MADYTVDESTRFFRIIETKTAMTKTFLISVGLVFVMWHAGSGADNSLASKFGRNRVKVQHADTPANMSDAKLQTVRSRYAHQIKQCHEQPDRNKQYCLQEAEVELRKAEHGVRDAADADE